MSRVVVVGSLRDGAGERARAILASGPPYDLAGSGLATHAVYLTEREVVFLFEGEEARGTVERLLGLPELWETAKEWREVLAGRPRLAREAFSWSRTTAG